MIESNFCTTINGTTVMSWALILPKRSKPGIKPDPWSG
jgi:hypothetical protein